ncbi:MAG: DUF255 domain-containing protein [Bacteroidia bacterium]|nr:DUF255 domain-containing protein [Bacteroidia bacterium]
MLLRRFVNISVILSFFLTSLFSPILAGQNEPSIIWVSFQYASQVSSLTNRKVLIYIYTEWCSWCKLFQKKTLKTPEVIHYLNDIYFCVKINAETKEDIQGKDKTFSYLPQQKVNQLAHILLDGKMQYPAFVILNEQSEIICRTYGYQDPATFLKMAKYYGDKSQIYLKKKWEEYAPDAIISEEDSL